MSSLIVRPLTLFASLGVAPNGILALLAIPEAFDERVEWLGLELSLSRGGSHARTAKAGGVKPRKRKKSSDTFLQLRSESF